VAREAQLVPVLGIAVAVLAGGCEKDEPLAFVEEQSQRDCRMPFTEYDAGSEVGGYRREAIVTSCSRRPNVTYIYGTCEATSDTGCAPPLEVQTWSYCHRKPHHSSATDFGVRRGPVTVIIFATDDGLAKRAVRLLRKAKPAHPSLPLTRKLRACGAR
jgi:hypothetical protein